MGKILIVEDNECYLQFLGKFLQHHGFEVEMASTVTQAREIIRKENILLISSDMELPDGSGFEILDELRAFDRDLPFLIISCREKEDYEKDALLHGATLCIDKMHADIVKDRLLEYACRKLLEEHTM